VFEPEKFGHLNWVDASTRNTKIYKEAFADNPMTFLRKEYEDTMRMSDAIYSSYDAEMLIKGLDYEKPAIGNINGIPFRAKADAIGANGIVDLKTTTGLAEGSFPYNARKYGYASQVFIYCNLFGVEYQDFKFLCICKDTKDIAVYDVSEEFYFQGEELVVSAINTYREWFSEGGKNIDEYIIKGIL
jgi:hypothetical protein